MNNKKNILLVVLAVGVIAMTVAFAAFSTNLRISGTASIPNVNWNIHFANWAEDTADKVTEGGVTHSNTAEYPSVNELQMSLKPNVTLVEGLNITLYQPGDYAKYTFNIVNEGTIDGSLDNFTHTMTCESGKNCDFLEYTVECKDSSLNTVTNGYVLPKNGGSVSCYLQLKFKDVDNLGANTTNNANNLQASIVNGVYTQEATSASLSAIWGWIQKQESQANNNQQTGGQSGGSQTPTYVYASYEDGDNAQITQVDEGHTERPTDGQTYFRYRLDNNELVILPDICYYNDVYNGELCLVYGNYANNLKAIKAYLNIDESEIVDGYYSKDGVSCNFSSDDTTGCQLNNNCNVDVEIMSDGGITINSLVDDDYRYGIIYGPDQYYITYD